MKSFPESVNDLIFQFTKLPGIGRVTAQRLTFHILNSKREYSQSLSNALSTIHSKITHCTICHSITESNPCVICSDNKRDDTIICVVENPYEIFVFEKTNSYRGKYHVLGGVLSPLDGVGPEDLNIDSLIDRITPNLEVMLAINPSVEGETTSLYLAKILMEKNTKTTRLARGVPVGSDLEYIDQATLIRAMEGRTSV